MIYLHQHQHFISGAALRKCNSKLQEDLLQSSYNFRNTIKLLFIIKSKSNLHFFDINI